MRVVSIGECMAELAPSGRDTLYSLGFAGDTFNTAWYLARLATGIDVSYFTAIGDDTTSQNMKAFMGSSRIDVSDILTIPNRTAGLYLISLEDGERSFSYWRGQSAARELASDADALGGAVGKGDVIYFSGITLAIIGNDGRKTLLSTLSQARASGKLIVFDPNLRPKLWGDSTEMQNALMDGAGVSDIVLPSYEDEANWFGDASPSATAQRYAAVGASCVVVKNGVAPVFYLQEDTTGETAVPAIERPLDTTAAGDSFNAAILEGLATRAPLRDSVARAIRLSGLVVQGKGALVPFDPADFATQSAD